MANHIGAVDQGTTSTRFIVFDRAGKTIATAQKEHEQIYPQPGWVEHDPEEIWQRPQEVIAAAMAEGSWKPADLTGVGITNHSDRIVLWTRKPGKPACNAVVWQDTRVAGDVAKLARDRGQDAFRAKTGLPLATYFSGLKVRWLLENVPGLRRQTEAGEILFGNIDTFLVCQPTGGANGEGPATHVPTPTPPQPIHLTPSSRNAQGLT